MLREQQHNYEVQETQCGFDIIPKDTERKIISATINENGIWKINNSYGEYLAYDFHRLLDRCVNVLYDDWKSPKEEQRYTPRWLYPWMMKTTGKVINHAVHNIWRKKVDGLPEIVGILQKRCFSISPNGGNYEAIIEIIKENNKYIIDDLLKYRASVIAFLYADNIVDNNWMNSYSPSGSTYRTLNKTLMHLPGGVAPGKIYHSISDAILEEPITSKIRMLAFCSLQPRMNQFWGNEHASYSTIKKSTDEDIRNAVKYMWRYFPDKGSGDFRRNKSIESALGRIFDYTGSWNNIDILGLAKRSVEYHRNEELRRRLQEQEWEQRRIEMEQRREEERQAYEEKMKKMKLSNTSLPKIPLPDDKHIRLLKTYQEVVDEGNLMHHCIANYAVKAVEGGCYLFHTDYKGEMASTEVLPNGVVAQSYGEHDKVNGASEYATNVLRSWGRRLVQ